MWLEVLPGDLFLTGIPFLNLRWNEMITRNSFLLGMCQYVPSYKLPKSITAWYKFKYIASWEECEIMQ